MKTKPVIPRALARRDVEDAVDYYAGEEKKAMEKAKQALKSKRRGVREQLAKASDTMLPCYKDATGTYLIGTARIVRIFVLFCFVCLFVIAPRGIRGRGPKLPLGATGIVAGRESTGALLLRSRGSGPHGDPT